jgi:hypothetical protein
VLRRPIEIIAFIVQVEGESHLPETEKGPTRGRGGLVSLHLPNRGHHAARADINVHVTIRTEEAEVPSEFPPARLFLDDIEEIVRILVAAAESRKREGILHEDRARTRLTLTVKDRVCDEVQELPRLARKTINLLVKVEIESPGWSVASIRFNRYGTSLSFYGVTRQEKLSTFHDLAPIFKRRNLWLATRVRPLRNLFLTLMVLLTLVNIGFDFSLKKQVPLRLEIVMSVLATVIVAILLATTLHHSIIILRHSSEPSTVSQGLRDKLPAALIGVVVGSVLGFLFTLLGFYLKHKYWP